MAAGTRKLLFPLLCAAASLPTRHAFKSTIQSGNKLQASGNGHRRPHRGDGRGGVQSRSHVSVRQEAPCILQLSADDDDPGAAPTTIADGVERRFSAASTEKTAIEISSGEDDTTVATAQKAATGSVNDRLLSEIQASVDKEKYGNSKGRDYFKDFRSEKTEEERQRSIEEARDLNGVNPLVCIGGAAFAWVCAGGLWLLTTFLGVFFASHPLETDVYFVQRLAQVFRNAIMGLSSLASGFFGVIGVGIFLLGIRVAYGVVTGELDPTPIKRPKSEEFVMPDVWGLMMGKKPNRRGNRGEGDDNPFGL